MHFGFVETVAHSEGMGIAGASFISQDKRYQGVIWKTNALRMESFFRSWKNGKDEEK